ncbi:ejaculatory bulb-specific protein 3-like [Schistocerca gregaria]|uniref:ejaculatory bulb-specific protein 3-like n=1 Tax=Schistocerca gregaria TaxID=7010 RepID=UPI00211F2559|nr:ejaculatory bulb-specific protein 3-like [Schistocerca gregaria]
MARVSAGCAVLMLALVAVGVASAAAGDGKYTTRYDNINLDDILHSTRLLNSYINCLMERGPCTADGRELKDNLPDALQTDCSKCSEKQKDGAEKVVNFLIENRPDQWKELEAKYDPTGIYKRKYEARLKKQ